MADHDDDVDDADDHENSNNQANNQEGDDNDEDSGESEDSEQDEVLRVYKRKTSPNDLDAVVRDVKIARFASSCNDSSAEIVSNEVLREKILAAATSVMAALPAAQPNVAQPDGYAALAHLITTNHTELSESINQLRSQMTNLEAKRYNKKWIEWFRGDVPFRPLVKQVRGNGDGLPQLPGHARGRARARARVPDIVLALGDAIPHPYFPANRNELRDMSDSHLNIASVLFNDDFGIVAADNLADRRHKYESYIT